MRTNLYFLVFFTAISVSLSLAYQQNDSRIEDSTLSGDDSGDSDGNDCASGTDDHCADNNEVDYCADDSDLIDTLQQIHEENANDSTVAYRVDNFNQTVDRFTNLQQLAQRLFSPYRQSGAKLFELLSTADLSEQCFTSLVSIFGAIQRNKIWALKFLDSSGGIPSGFTDVTMSSFGDYDQCLDIISEPTGDRNLTIAGQYCLLKVKVAYPSIESYKPGDPVHSNLHLGADYLSNFNLANVFQSTTKLIETLHISNGTIYRHGICIPSTCTASEVQHVINTAFYPITRFHVEVGPNCDIKDKPRPVLDAYQLYSILILFALIFVAILSTLVDVSLKLSNNNCLQYPSPGLVKDHKQNPSTFVNYLLSFSIWRNTENLFKANEQRFPSLETIKLLVILNALTSHFHLFTSFTAIISLKRVFTSIPMGLLHSGKYFFVRNPIILDALFSMSGFILSYGLLRKFDKTNGRFSYASYAIFRWIRFVVPIFGSFLFFFLVPFIGDGPIWEHGMNYFMTGCKSNLNFVSSFLLVNNFVDMLDLQPGVVKTCNPPTWFVSALFQLHLIAPVLVILYHKKPKIAFYVNTVMILIGTFASISPQILFGIKPYSQHMLITTWEGVNNAFKWYHMATVQWITSFFVGIMFGYGLKIDFKVSNTSSVFCWLVSVFVIFVCYVWNNNLWRLEPTVSDLNALGFYSIGKLFASIALCWIFFACCTGRGGLVNKVLSWSGFTALSNLSFSIFITHVIIFIYRTFTIRETHIMNDSYMAKNFVVDLMLCICVAYIYNMLVESPFNNVIAILMKPNAKKANNDNSTQLNGTIKNNLQNAQSVIIIKC